MSCGFEKELLSGYADGELDARERADAEKHLASCAECRRELEELRGSVAQLQALPKAKAPPALAVAVARGIAPPRAAGFRRWIPVLSAAAAVMLVVGTVIVIRPAARSAVPDIALAQGKPASASRAPAEDGFAGKGGNRQEQMDDKDMEESAGAPRPSAPAAEPVQLERKKAEGAIEGAKAGDANTLAPGAQAARRGGPAAISYFNVVSGDAARARREVEELFKGGSFAFQAGSDLKTWDPAVATATEADARTVATVHHVTLELTDAQLESFRRFLQAQAASLVPSTEAGEREFLAQAEKESQKLGKSARGDRAAAPPAPSRELEDLEAGARGRVAGAAEESAGEKRREARQNFLAVPRDEQAVRRKIVLRFVQVQPPAAGKSTK